jgi:hypothetical protein
VHICKYDEEIAQPPPIMEKVKNAVEKLKNNKSSWVDNPQAELLKYSAKEVVNELHDIILQIRIIEDISKH